MNKLLNLFGFLLLCQILVGCDWADMLSYEVDTYQVVGNPPTLLDDQKKDNNDYPNDSNVWIYKHHNDRKTLMLRRSVGSLLNRLSKRAKLNKNISPHSFRHTAISNDLDRGMPESRDTVAIPLLTSEAT